MIQLADRFQNLQGKFTAKLADENEEVVTANLVVMPPVDAVVSKSKGYSANVAVAVAIIIDGGGAFVIANAFFIVIKDDVHAVAATRALVISDETAVVDNHLWDDTLHLKVKEKQSQEES